VWEKLYSYVRYLAPSRDNSRPVKQALAAIVCLFLAVSIFDYGASGEPAPASESGQISRRALLVGCTVYPSLSKDFQLEGPANDVELFRDFLEQRYHFAREEIVTLTENENSPERKPTKANIFRELDRLSTEVHAGDQVVVLMAGHGSQQPAHEDPENPKSGGYEEIFLPGDIGKWDSSRGEVANAISNKELGSKIRAILGSGARVWAIIDSCHSGAMLRGGNGKEKLRQVPMRELVPDEVIRKHARASTTGAEKTRGGVSLQPAPQMSLFDLKGWVATYAAQSFEPTVEKYLPPDDSDAKSHGLLSFAIVKILSETKTALSYQELIQEIYRYYNGMGRTFPTPLLEGTDLQREVLGESAVGNRASLRLVQRDGDHLKVNAGSLNGLSKGSVLAVRPPISESGEETKPLGYVRVESIELFEATVIPCEFDDLPAVDTLPDGAICRIAYTDFGEKMLSFSLENSDLAASDPELLKRLESVGQREGSLIRWTKNAADADWLLRINGNEAFLLPAGGTLEADQRAPGSAGLSHGLIGPTPVNLQLTSWVDDQLQKIARARFLLQLAADPAFAQGENDSVRVETAMIRYKDSDDRIGQQEAGNPNQRELKSGDIISFEVRNSGDGMVDISLLYIDSRDGITCLYPRIGSVEDNRLHPGERLRTPRLKVTNDSTGLEHVVAIAVKAEGAPIDFSFLQQSSLDLTRSADGYPRSMRTPLGELLKSSMYGAGHTRGLAPADSAKYLVRSLSWRVAD